MYNCICGSFPELNVFVKNGEIEATSPYAEKITVISRKDELHVICGRTPNVITTSFDRSVMKDNLVYSKTIWRKV
jgi:hypothetical protein